MPVITRNLGLIIPDGASPDTRANLLKIDALGGTGIFNIDSTQSTNIQAVGAVNITPNAPSLGGTGVGGNVNIGQSGQNVILQINGLAQASGTLGTLDTAVGGDKYLRVAYKSDIAGPVDIAADRQLNVDLQGADRNLVLGGDLVTDVALDISGIGGAYTLPGPGEIVTEDGVQTLTNKTIVAGANSISGIADANVAPAANIALTKIQPTTASRALQSSATGVTEASNVTSTELGYLSGVTSAVQTQLDNKQPLNAELTGLTGIGGAGITIRQAPGTYTTRILQGTASQIAVANGDGIGANPQISLTNTAVAAGAYGNASNVASFLVDAQGRLTGASNVPILIANANVSPTAAIDGTKITPDFGTQNVRTDGQFLLDSGTFSTGFSAPVLTASYIYTLPPTFPPSSGQILTSDTSGILTWTAPIAGGTVTSVGLSLPGSVFNISGSPVTMSGTLTGTFANQSQNFVFSGPATGGAGVPDFRALVEDDLPNNIALSKLAPLAANFALESDATGEISASSVTSTELNYVSGVTSSIQTQLDNKQPLDADLTALAALATNGLIARTGAGTAATRTITAASSRVTVTDGDGVAGNPTVDVAEGNININNLSGTLSVTKGGTNSTTALVNNRVMQSASGAIVEAAAITANRALISDANGIPTHSVTTNTELAFVNGVTSAIQTQLNARVLKAGDTMTGALILPAGTDIAPSLGVGDTDVGLYSGAANTLNFTTAGVERMKITDTGRVSIGTNVIGPAGLLDVVHGGTPTNVTFNLFSLSTNNAVNIQHNNANTIFASRSNNASSESAASIVLARSRGDVVTKTQALSGDAIGFIGAQGYTNAGVFGPGFGTGIVSRLTENATATGQGSRLEIYTAANGSATPALRTQIDSSGVTIPSLTASRAVVTGSGGLLQTSTTTSTEIGFVAGVTSAIQTQLDARVLKAGDTMTGFLTLNADPINPLHAATKQYVDALSGGTSVKQGVRVATTTNITLSGLPTIDGVTVVALDRVLVKNQSTLTENGIYVAAAGAWARSSDMDTGPEFESALVTVAEGTAQANTGWFQITDNVVVGVSNIVFNQFFGAGTYAADGVTLQLVGATFSIATGGVSNAQVNASAAIDLSKLAALTADRALQSNSSGVISASAVTNTELGYLAGVTSAIQTQLGARVLKAGDTMTGALVLPVGSVSAPSLGVGAADTGLFSPATDVLAAATDGTERARFTSTGQLLIGTTTADAVALVRVNGAIRVNASNEEDGITGRADIGDTYIWGVGRETNGAGIRGLDGIYFYPSATGPGTTEAGTGVLRIQSDTAIFQDTSQEFALTQRTYRATGIPGLGFQRARNVIGSPNPPLGGDSLGEINWGGWDGSDWTRAFAGQGGARLQVGADNTWSSTERGTFYNLQLTPSASLSIREVHAISAAGDHTIGANGESPTHRINTALSPGVSGGSGTPLPAQPIGYIQININGTLRAIPFYGT
jgi:hypothetical protein